MPRQRGSCGRGWHKSKAAANGWGQQMGLGPTLATQVLAAQNQRSKIARLFDFGARRKTVFKFLYELQFLCLELDRRCRAAVGRPGWSRSLHFFIRNTSVNWSRKRVFSR